MNYNKRAVVFLAWGSKYVNLVVKNLRAGIPLNYPIILITDQETFIDDSINIFQKVIRVEFELSGLRRKCEILKHLPDEYETFLFLDCDTIVLEDVSLGFDKAEEHGLALAPAPHYSLDVFFGFDTIMKREGLELKGQLQYNTGVIFLHKTETVIKIFNQWLNVAREAGDHYHNDQPFLTLIMEKLQFNPYTLSPAYNYRAFGEVLSGPIRIWHSYNTIPPGIIRYKTKWPWRIQNGIIKTFNPYRINPLVNLYYRVLAKLFK
jgi:hypothetical protein